MSGGNLLVTRGLSVFRSDEALFENLEFSLSAGEIVRVEGDNGTGKTTLLRLLCGLGEADEGDVLWQGRPLHKQLSQARGEIIFLGHKAGINGAMTAFENLAFLCSLESHVSENDIVDALQRVNLAAKMELPCRLLSAGQKRRVALARLLLTRARIWILDEPLTALDVSGREWLETLLLEHVANGGSAIVTTHQDFLADNPVARPLRLMGSVLA